MLTNRDTDPRSFGRLILVPHSGVKRTAQNVLLQKVTTPNLLY